MIYNQYLHFFKREIIFTISKSKSFCKLEQQEKESKEQKKKKEKEEKDKREEKEKKEEKEEKEKTKDRSVPDGSDNQLQQQSVITDCKMRTKCVDVEGVRGGYCSKQLTRL